MYLNYLIDQFKQATGIKHIDINSETFINEFSKWLLYRQKIVDKYAQYVSSLEKSPLMVFGGVEFGKTKYDTVSEKLDLSVITRHTKGLEHTDKLIMAADLVTRNGQPILLTPYKEKKSLSDRIGVYCTHNPYFDTDITTWPLLHNMGKNIVFGMCGSIYDRDCETKLKLLETIKAGMQQDYTFDYIVDGDNYYYALQTEASAKSRSLFKVKERVKTKEEDYVIKKEENNPLYIKDEFYDLEHRTYRRR